MLSNANLFNQVNNVQGSVVLLCEFDKRGCREDRCVFVWNNS